MRHRQCLDRADAEPHCAADAARPRRRGDRMKRREFISLIGGAAASPMLWPLGGRAQQSSHVRLVGVLMASAQSDPEAQARVRAFEAGLRELGWVEGRNLRLEYRFVPD